ncbi:hypothetical protein MHYP_G00177360 [Metynnis hypsauchen]
MLLHVCTRGVQSFLSMGSSSMMNLQGWLYLHETRKGVLNIWIWMWYDNSGVPRAFWVVCTQQTAVEQVQPGHQQGFQ